ncbi:hypothetical protein A9R05_42375 (plasmid) [Burkholderia sp. KK1]|nr:hypothetical protein A9R05_42375 [Burkholderia sp. KK1]
MSTVTAKKKKFPLIRHLVSAVGFAILLTLFFKTETPDFYADYMQAYPGFFLLLLFVASFAIQVGIQRAWQAWRSR